MLIPETLNGEKLGLTKFQREYSASPEPILHPRSKSNSRESSPFGSGSLRSVSFSPDESGGRGRSPTPPISREQAQLKVGDRVIVKSSVGDAKVGTLKFLGTVEFEEGNDIQFFITSMFQKLKMNGKNFEILFRSLGRD